MSLTRPLTPPKPGDPVSASSVATPLRQLDDDVRYLDGLNTKVPDGETVSIIPAVAGG